MTVQTLVLKRRPVNIDRLIEELQLVGGDDYIALSLRPDAIVIYVQADTDQPTLRDIRRTVRQHDHRQLSQDQQRHQRQRDELRAAREAYALRLRLDDFANADPLIKQLAETVYRLGLEVRHLRTIIQTERQSTYDT